MQTQSLYSFLSDVEGRKVALGVDESASAVDALRNSGKRRTPAKRALLRAAADRARTAGVEPIPARF